MFRLIWVPVRDFGDMIKTNNGSHCYVLDHTDVGSTRMNTSIARHIDQATDSTNLI